MNRGRGPFVRRGCDDRSHQCSAITRRTGKILRVSLLQSVSRYEVRIFRGVSYPLPSTTGITCARGNVLNVLDSIVRCFDRIRLNVISRSILQVHRTHSALVDGRLREPKKFRLLTCASMMASTAVTSASVKQACDRCVRYWHTLTSTDLASGVTEEKSSVMARARIYARNANQQI